MGPRTISITIPYDPKRRNKLGETLIPFDPAIVGTNPTVFLMPWWDGNKGGVPQVPTVTGISTVDGTVPVVTVKDDNAADNYFLNALLVSPDIDNIHGLTAMANSTHKKDFGVQVVSGLPSGNSVDLLTPRWINPTDSAVVSIETIRSIRPASPGGKASFVETFSGWFGSDYFVNHLSCARQILPHAAQSGTVHKAAGAIVQVHFPVPWVNPPIVFATPWSKGNVIVNDAETINKVTPNYFELASGNGGSDYFINWLAVTSNPNFHKDHVDKGIQHFLENFPQYSADVEAHRAGLISAILNNTPPPAEFMQMRERGVLPTPLPGPIYGGPKIYLDMATLGLDGIGLLLSCLGASAAFDSIKYNRIKDTIAAQLNAVPTEAQALIRNTQALREALEAATASVERAKLEGRIILAFLGGMFTLGTFKTIFVAIYSTMPPWQWIVLAVKLGSQLIAIVAGIVATAGAGAIAEAIAWMARFASIILGTSKIGVDFYNLITDLSKGSDATPA